MTPIVWFLPVYFVIGAILIPFVNRRHPEQSRKLWIKYGVYLAVVSIVCAATWLKVFHWLAAGFVLAGLIELALAWMKSGRKAGVLVGGLLVYAAVSLGFLVFVFLFSPDVILVLFTMTVIFDGFSQLTGQLFGKRKLLPRTSPDKTVGGFLGGCFVLFLSLVIISFLSNKACAVSRWDYMLRETGVSIVLALTLGIMALCGDWLASKFKRICGVKDYGNWIPGHGGLLDRFDSFMFCSAVFAGMSALAISFLT